MFINGSIKKLDYINFLRHIEYPVSIESLSCCEVLALALEFMNSLLLLLESSSIPQTF